MRCLSTKHFPNFKKEEYAKIKKMAKAAADLIVDFSYCLKE
jgi:hypothetical protein